MSSHFSHSKYSLHLPPNHQPVLSKIKVAVFLSGAGSNAENLVRYFRNHSSIEIASFYCNNPNALAIGRAEKLNLPCHIFSKADFIIPGVVIEKLLYEQIDFIVLAGFLWLVPKYLIDQFPSKIINIHPALLPKYGGKGMYGAKVHEAVVMNKEFETGISIHFVDEFYDEGNIIFQANTKVDPLDTPEIIAQKVHQLEYEHFPLVVEQIILKYFSY